MKRTSDRRPFVLAALLAAGLAPTTSLAQAAPSASAVGTTGAAGLRPSSQPRLITLDDALRMAAEQSIDLRIARARVEESHANVTRAWGFFLPNISLSGEYLYSFPEQEVAFIDPDQLEQQALLFDSIANLTEGAAAQNPDPVARQAALEQAAALRASAKDLRDTEAEPIVIQPAHVVNGQLQIALPLFNARAFPALGNALGAAEVAQLSMLQAKAAVLWNVARAYHQIAAAKQLVASSREQVASTRRHAAIAQQRFELGLETQLALERATIELKRAEQLERQAAGSYRAAKASLAGILGIVEDYDVAIPPPVPALDVGAPFDDLLARASAHRVDLRLQRELLAIADRNRQEAWLRFLPSFQVVGQGRYTSNVSGLIQTPFTGSVGVQASVPIFDGGQTVAAIQEANARATQEVLRTRLLEETVERELRGTLDDIALKRENAETAREVAALAKKTAEHAENLYGQGAATQIDVNDARVSAFTAEVEATRAQLDLETARLGLAYALGELTTFVQTDDIQPAPLEPDEEARVRAFVAN